MRSFEINSIVFGNQPTDLAAELLRLIRATVDAGDLHAIIADVAEDLGFPYFALITHEDLRIDKPGKVDVRRYPAAVADRLINQGQFRRDPVMRGCFFADSAFLWSDLGKLIKLDKRDRDILEFGSANGLVEGITIPCSKWGQTFGSCTFAGSSCTERASHLLGLAHMVGVFAFQRARQIAGAPLTPKPRVRLNPRPRDCILLAGRGLSNKEIARKLNISPMTVDRYLKDARRLFGVTSRAELLWAAMLAGEIDPSEAG